MMQAGKTIRASMVAAALICGAGFATWSPATHAAAAMCPPSEGEFDFDNVDISGDGMVLLPETVKIKAVASTSKTDANGKLVVDKRVTLLVQDPTKPDQQVMAMRLTPMAAEEVKEWLSSAIDSQEKLLKDSKVTEKPGIECTLDAKRCREMTVGGTDGKAATKKAVLPAMWVTVTSQGGTRHGWSTMTDTPVQTLKTSCTGGESGTVASKPAAAPVDPRIAITTYDRTAGGRPLTVKMDTPTAKALLADLGCAIDERNGKAQPVIEQQKDENAKTAS